MSDKPESEKETIKENRLILVEGSHEVKFFEAFLKHMRISGVQVKDCGGKNKMIKRMHVITKLPGFELIERLVVVRDADSNPKTAFQSVTDCLKKNGLTAPKTVGIFEGSSPKVMVVILPSSTEKGALERLCLRSIESEPVLNCVDSYFECLRTKGVDITGLNEKHRIQIYLASKPEDFLNTGTAAQKYWNFDHPAFESVRAFLTELAAE